MNVPEHQALAVSDVCICAPFGHGQLGKASTGLLEI